MKVDVLTLSAEKAGQIELADEIYGLDPRKDILHRCVTWQLAKRQQGTHRAMPRNEVRMTGKKSVRQKGSGGARHGNKAAPQFRGGGVAHPPRSRSHAIDLPKKVRRLALRHALSAKARTDGLVVIDEALFEEGKTKALAEKFAQLGFTDVLIVDGDAMNDGFRRAARNLPGVDVLPVIGANVYDILRRQKLVLTKAAVAGLEARLK